LFVGADLRVRPNYAGIPYGVAVADRSLNLSEVATCPYRYPYPPLNRFLLRLVRAISTSPVSSIATP